MVRKGWTIEVPEGWTQIIRGPRPPSAKWQPQKGKRIPSADSKNGNDVKKSPLEKLAVLRKESVPPDVAAAAARKRVEKLEAVLVSLGEDDDIFPVIREALTKARAQAQVVRAHSSLQVVFGERTQTGRVCPSNNCEGTGEFGRGCCGAGEARSIVGGWRAEVESASSRGEEQSFSFHCSTSSSGRFCRMQGVINDLQRELARLRPVQPVDPTILDDESMALVPVPQSASVLMSELIEEAHAKRPRVATGSGTGARLQAAAPGCKPGTG